ncbi:MAG TPA: hypothetical protein VFD82_04515 [Planctomycetota bacterium]|nr:hypothetical protein [Planctomycetota bacterium]
MSGLDPILRHIVSGHEAETDHRCSAAASRRQAVMAMQKAGALRSAADQLAAASVLVFSEVAAEVQAAQALALTAMPMLRRARLLAATAYDRLRRLAGEPQKFGTQVVEREGARELWPVDPNTTDSERAKWDVPPLAEILRNLGKR